MKQKQYILLFFGNRGHCGVAGFDDCISSMQDIWHTNEFTSICYGYRVCHTKTHISSLYYRGKIYYRSHPSIILGISQEKSQ